MEYIAQQKSVSGLETPKMAYGYVGVVFVTMSSQPFIACLSNIQMLTKDKRAVLLAREATHFECIPAANRPGPLLTHFRLREQLALYRP